MAMQESGWSYYIPSNGETSEDAVLLKRYGWQRKLYDAEDAAEWASQMYWDDGGYECGTDQETEAVIIDPKGQETFWTFTYEETINYMAKTRKVDS